MSSVAFSQNYTCNDAEKQYAVIFSGYYNNINNDGKAHFNDCAYLYKTLVNVYGYNKDHIYVLLPNGVNDKKDLDGDGLSDIYASATKNDIDNLFTTLGNILTKDNNLFVFIDGHGNYLADEYGTYRSVFTDIYKQTISSLDLWQYFNRIDNACWINLLVGTCNAGGFTECLARGNCNVFTASSTSDGAVVSYNLYTRFIYYFIKALNGEDYHNEQVGNWIADANSDGEVTLKEAFTYADEIEYHLPNHSNPVHGTTKQSVYNVITLCNKSYNCYNNGTFLPQEITSNMTLTSDYYGYVEIVVKSGATRK